MHFMGITPKIFLASAIVAMPLLLSAKTQVVDMYTLTPNKQSPSIGTIGIKETPWGLLFTPNLKKLSLGVHGFHIHENASCASLKKNRRTLPGLAAGGHYDPQHTQTHQGPYGQGHLGDLPVLYTNHQGNTTLPVLAPRIKYLKEIKGRALMIHTGGDNYSDTPSMGGGGARVACGIINELR